MGKNTFPEPRIGIDYQGATKLKRKNYLCPKCDHIFSSMSDSYTILCPKCKYPLNFVDDEKKEVDETQNETN